LGGPARIARHAIGRSACRDPHDRQGGDAGGYGLGQTRLEASRRRRSLGALVDDLAAARIGATFNQYAGSELRRRRLEDYLVAREGAHILLVGEAAGYRGARVSGIPFTSERQLTGTGPAEATATIVHAVLRELGIEEDVLLWNVVPTHPGTASSNRRPTRAEIEGGLPFLRELARGRRAIAVGRVAHAKLGGRYVRHPSHGGARAFRAGVIESLR
jgi:uracil-DNA glycosylase